MIQTRLEEAIKSVVGAVGGLNFSNQAVYATWLAQAYYFVKHSTPMLALSAGYSAENREYHARCLIHLSEEKGHDKMLLNDLKIMGFDIVSFPELPSTQALYQTQYFWIQHRSPTSFLGYIVLLEGLAIHAGKSVLNQVGKMPATFLKLHAEEDVDHLQKAYKIIEALPKSEQDLILQNAELAAHLYVSMVHQIADFGASAKSA